MRSTLLGIAAAASLLIASTAYGQVATIKPLGYFGAFGPVVDPDGEAVAWLEFELGSRHVWRLDLQAGERRRLTTNAGMRTGFAWAPSGETIAVTEDGADRGGLWLVNAASGTEHQVLAASGARDPRWAGSDVVSMVRGLGDESELVLVRLADLHVEVVYRGSGIEAASLAPDGRTLVWLATSAAGGQLAAATADGPNSRVLAPALRFSTAEGPLWALGGSAPFVWTPDGASVVVTAHTELDPVRRAWEVPLDGSPPRRLYDGDADVLGVSFDRRGDLFLSTYEVDMGIGLVSAAGGEPRRLTSIGEQALLPAWTPDGQRFGYSIGPWHRSVFPASMDIAWAEIDVISRRAGPSEPLVAENHEDYGPAWSPDGRWLAFHSHVNNTDDIYVRSTQRGDTALILMSDFGKPGHETGGPAWAPDMRTLVFSSSPEPWGPSALFRVEFDPGLGNRVAGPHRIDLDGFQGSAYEPRVSPDGTTIAFNAVKAAGGDRVVATAPLNGGSMRIVTHMVTGDIFSAPEWAADGNALLVAIMDESRRSVIRRIDLLSGAATDITTSGDSYHPRLSPTGDHLLVTLWNTRVKVWRQTGVQ